MMYRSHHLISTPASLIDGCRRVGLSEPLIVTQLRAAPFLVSCGFTLLGAVFLVVAFTTGGGRGNLAAGDTPDALPRILLFAWVGLGLADILRQVVGSRTSSPATDGDPAEGVRDKSQGSALAGVMALTLVLSIAIVFAGYLLPVLICLPVILFLTGTRKAMPFAAAFLLLGPGLWFLFHHMLGIRLPILLPGGLL